MAEHSGRFLGVSARPRSDKRPRSLAGQVFVLQAAVVILLVAAMVATLVLQSRRDNDRAARERSITAAQSYAHSPGLVEALRSPDPSAVLQPLTESARKTAGVDFIVVTDTGGIRHTHPKPELIGQRVVADIEPALAGHPIVESVDGPLGRETQAVVPVTDSQGSVVGVVVAGLRVKNVSGALTHQLPLILGTSAAALALATVGTAFVTRRLRRQTHGLGPAEMTRMYEHHDSVLHSVREGVVIVDGDGRLLLANDEARKLLDLPPDAEGRVVTDLPGLDTDIAELLASGRTATDEVHLAGDLLLAVNQRSTAPNGTRGPRGTVATIRDSTELLAVSGHAEAARKRLRLLYDAGVRLGTTLDVPRTAEELAAVAVPRFADFVTVDVADAVLAGELPSGPDVSMRRIAVQGIRDDHPLYPCGRLIDFGPSTPQARGLGSGRAEVIVDLSDAPGWHAQDPQRTREIVDYGIHSLITAPILARGVPLGLVNFWRMDKPGPFDDEDLSVAEELVARAAINIDNARRYTREHTMAVTLQRSLLPRALPEQSALEVAYRYLPAQSGVSGDWFDVILLSGARVALVVGDVVGHGLHAAATMGRLRTAVHNFSRLDLAPGELLGHLDDLVGAIDQDEMDPAVDAGISGATCVYAIYDPVSRRCALARAGHPPPALVRPDGTVVFPDVPAGPPLGVGGMPFDTVELELDVSTQLVLYTDGLVEDRTRDIDVGIELLRRSLAVPGRASEESCKAVLEALLPQRPKDDVALLIARTRALGTDQVADWDVPFDPASVAAMRDAVAAKLADWRLAELEFTTELVLSELITNAIRYGSPPVRVRLLRDRALICEVSDSSSTAPHLRYAATMDEGGRGLFLVAQMTARWGTRYTHEGKVIWAEQPLPSAGAEPSA